MRWTVAFQILPGAGFAAFLSLLRGEIDSFDRQNGRGFFLRSPCHRCKEKAFRGSPGQRRKARAKRDPPFARSPMANCE
jgi:hypothetical protein